MRSPLSRAYASSRAASGSSVGAVAALEQRQEARHRRQRLAQVVRDDRREALQLGVGTLELRRAADRARALAGELLERLVQIGDVGARRGRRAARARPRPRRCSAASGSCRPCRRARASICRLSPSGMCSSCSANAITFARSSGWRKSTYGVRSSSAGVQPIVRSHAALTQRRWPSASAAPSRSCDSAKSRSAWAASASPGRGADCGMDKAFPERSCQSRAAYRASPTVAACAEPGVFASACWPPPARSRRLVDHLRRAPRRPAEPEPDCGQGPRGQRRGHAGGRAGADRAGPGDRRPRLRPDRRPRAARAL